MISPLVHIGYHKTGTSWLQTFLFENEAAGFCTPISRKRELPEALILPHHLDFDGAALRELFAPKLEDASTRGLVPIVSAERLSGNPHSGGYDSHDIAERLREVFPQARVLAVIREQKSMILSTYKQYVRVGGTCRLRDYLQPPYYRGRMPLRTPLFQFEYFRYDRLISLYQSLFGRDNVLILPYETFRADAPAFVSRIIEFAGARHCDLPYNARINDALSPATVALKRKTNFLAARDSLNPSVLIPIPRAKRTMDALTRTVGKAIPQGAQKSIEAKWKQEIASAVEGRYGESNRLTAEITGLDLGSFGYDMTAIESRT